MLDHPAIKEFQKAVWDYYHRNGRRFPWRETRDPYAILVSEIMLQQTQTERVVPKFLAWLDRFPTLESLAEASLEDVLKLWIGLGYNRRARFLRDAAQVIVTEHGGRVPQKESDLDALPGIGRYTARAVAAFAFDKPSVIIETNIRAAFLWWFFPEQENIPDSDLEPFIAAAQDVPVRDWYYALMDYGSRLKKLVPNPSRRSRHHTVQSAFAGSRRQARGAILRYLTHHGSADLETVAASAAAESAPVEYGLLAEAASLLESEGFITVSGTTVSLK